jgi:23S rRNA (adenine2503-C2)-methyltransferase
MLPAMSNPIHTAAAERTNLAGMGRAELAAEMAAFGAEPFRARQLWHWIYHRGATEFAAMSSLAKAFRERLAAHYELTRPAVSRALVSADGTRKWLLRFLDGNEVETVHIPEEDRGTLCVSSQVGCTLNCTFCHTGTQFLVRNLGAAEIVGQVMLARDALGEWPSPKDDRLLTNIVLMGMGEPLYNYDSVAAALKIVMDPEGLAISRRKITLSTAGVVPMLARVGAELGVNLAISLHAVTDELRDKLVPLNRKYPIPELLDACRAYPGLSNARRITFEYVMLKGINDSPAEARELVRLLQGIPAKVNLIPFNPWPGAPYECSSDRAITAFSDIVFAAGYSAPVRTPRGRDIAAACGQLKSASVRARRRATAATDGSSPAGCLAPDEVEGAGGTARDRPHGAVAADLTDDLRPVRTTGCEGASGTNASFPCAVDKAVGDG